MPLGKLSEVPTIQLPGLRGAMVARWTSTTFNRSSKGCGFEPRRRCFFAFFYFLLADMDGFGWVGKYMK